MRHLWVSIGAILLTGGAAGQLAQPEMLASRNAKMICSAVFVSGRTAEDLLQNEHRSPDFPAVDYYVNREDNSVTVRAPHGYLATAVYREECGCTVSYDLSAEEIRAQDLGRHAVPRYRSRRLWPNGDKVKIKNSSGVDRAQMQAALDYAFDEPDPEVIRGTRGVVVVQNGRIVAERYAPGYHEDMPLIAWSMTKSITNALIGILVKQGKLDIHAPAPVPEWADTSDPRHAITVDQLMRMSSGLKFQEIYQLGIIDVVVMLYGIGDAAGFAASQPLEARPDTVWSYSSGTTNIISRIIRNQLGGELDDYASFPRRELFNKLGMHRTVLEMDEAGTYIGSSFMFATPRDMARFGLFCMNDGVWKGEHILPEGWMKYSTAPTPKASKGQYGAQFWLNAGTPGDPADRVLPDVPADAYWLSGFQGQRVLVVPSRDAVIVRMGFTPTNDNWDWNHFLSSTLKALPEPGSAE